MNDQDLSFVITILKGEKPNDELRDWYSTLGFLSCHRIAGLFYNRARQLQVYLPKKIEKFLSNVFERQKRRVKAMRDAVSTLTEELATANVPYMLLKGSVLSNLPENERIYFDGERVSNDIDLLVSPNGISAASNVLMKLGYAQGIYDTQNDMVKLFPRMEVVKRRMSRGEVAPFVKRTGEKENPCIEVDINFSLGNTPSDEVELLKKMVEDSKYVQGKIGMNVPSGELFFLHLIMHQYKESCLYFMVERNKDLDLYKLADIFYILKNKSLDFDVLDALVQEYSLKNEMSVVLYQVGEIFEDDFIMGLANRYGNASAKIIDYENKKIYQWTVSARERICSFDARKYLEEIKQ